MHRSLLFVPADSPRKLAKAQTAGADALILDLEDSVPPREKPNARTNARAFREGEVSSAIMIRVNSLESGQLDADLDAVLTAPFEAIMLPKCQSPEDIGRVAEKLARLEQARGLPPFRILPIVTETVTAVRNLMRSNWRHERLAGLTWGAEDLTADMGAFANRLNGAYYGVFALARDLCLLAAKEAGVSAYDAVVVDVKDHESLKRECAWSFQTGFDGKLVIHPDQVDIVNLAFMPGAADIAWAHSVLAALSGAGTGVAVLDGGMIDAPHRHKAERVLQLSLRRTSA